MIATTADKTSITSAQIQRYAVDPMAFFADVLIPTAFGSGRLGDVWSPFQEVAFRELATCLLTVANRQRPPRRGLWIERTKGASKDTDVGIGLLWLLMFTRWPQLVELGADDLDQILETLHAMKDVIRLNPWMEKRIEVQKTRIVCETTASVCVFKTRDATGSHGSRPTVTVCNELSHCQSEEFISTMMDNADKNPNNLAIIATNAGHLDTWQYRWREQYRPDPAWFFQKVAEPGPWIDPAKVADAQRRNSPSRFARLWKGEWVTGGGDALNPEDIEAALTLPGPIMTRLPRSGAIMSVDLGVRRDHAGCCVVQGCVDDHRIKVAWVEDWQPTYTIHGKEIDLEAVYSRLLYLCRRYDIRLVKYDPWQCELIAQRLRANGIDCSPVNFSGVEATRMASTLLEVFRSRLIDMYRDASLTRDIGKLSIVERPGGNGFKLVAPRGENGHCDTAIALAMALPLIYEFLGYVTPADTQPNPQANMTQVSVNQYDQVRQMQIQQNVSRWGVPY